MKPNSHRAREWRPVVLLLAALLVFACSLGGPGKSGAPATQSPPRVTAPPPSATASAAATAQLPAPTQTSTSTPTDYEQMPPPIASLVHSDGAAVPGLQGSWCYERGCADIIPPPKQQLPMIGLRSPGALLMLTMPETDPFLHWAARYGLRPGDESTELDQGGSDFDPGAPPTTPYPLLTEVSFASPPRGDWVLAVALRFGPPWGGDAVYYWHVIVE